MRSTANPEFSLRYVIHPEIDEEYDFADEEERQIYQLPWAGAAYKRDNKRVWAKLESFVTGTEAAAYIEPFRNRMDGRAAALALTNHYLGEGAIDNRVNVAMGILESLHYKNEAIFPWEKFISRFTKCINILDASEDERLTDKQKVNKLIERIQSTDTKLLAAVEVIQEKHPRDFAMAANKIGAKISLLYKTVQKGTTRNQLQTTPGVQREFK